MGILNLINFQIQWALGLRVHKLDQNGHSTAEMFTHEVDIKGRGVIITCPQTTTDYIAQEGEVCHCKIKKKISNHYSVSTFYCGCRKQRIFETSIWTDTSVKCQMFHCIMVPSLELKKIKNKIEKSPQTTNPLKNKPFKWPTWHILMTNIVALWSPFPEQLNTYFNQRLLFWTVSFISDSTKS